jgi:hypothetical protein
MLRRGSPKLPFIERAAFRPFGGRLSGQTARVQMQHDPLCRVERRQLRRTVAKCVVPKAAFRAGSRGLDLYRSFAAGLSDVSAADEDETALAVGALEASVAR